MRLHIQTDRQLHTHIRRKYMFFSSFDRLAILSQSLIEYKNKIIVWVTCNGYKNPRSYLGIILHEAEKYFLHCKVFRRRLFLFVRKREIKHDVLSNMFFFSSCKIVLTKLNWDKFSFVHCTHDTAYTNAYINARSLIDIETVSKRI